MRILLTSHEPLSTAPAGARAAQLAALLAAAGHEVRLLAVDDSAQGAAPNERRVVCSQQAGADITMPRPTFSVAGSQHLAFDQLTDQQIDLYRDTLREVFDEEIHRFDPHLVHAQHLWLLAHLALESGVAYVAEAWGPELTTLGNDARWDRYMSEAAENAAQILTNSPELPARLRQNFAELDTPITSFAPGEMTTAAGCQILIAVYRAAVTRRFGCADPP
jgi:hypothetical protein